MSNEWIQEARMAVSQDEIAEALKLLFTNNKSSSKENTLILLTGRWNRVRKEQREGTSHRQDSMVELNRIKSAILDLLTDFDSPFFNSFEDKFHPEQSQSRWRW